MRRTFDELVLEHRRALIVTTHVAAFAISLVVAFMLRFDAVVPDLPEAYRDLMWMSLPGFVMLKLVVFGLFRQYSGWWRYVSVSDLLGVLKAALVSMLVVAGVVYIRGLREFPRSVIVLDALVTTGLLSALRVTTRLMRERWFGSTLEGPEHVERTLVVGTGPSAESLIREARRSPALGVVVTGVVAEDARHVGTRMGAANIQGTVEDIPRLVREHDATLVVVALEAGNGDLMRRVVAQCTSADVKHRVLPPAEVLMQGRVSVSNIREVNLQDLLGRPPVRLQSDRIASAISGETVMVTGAGGSIGSELCRQVARFGAARIVLLEQAENPLFHLERELAPAHPEVRLTSVVCDIYDAERLQRIMLRYRPAVVLHAAAHKHVPLMEANPTEAIKNNVMGTYNVIRAAQAAEVERCVLISTDKAVNPTSVMGASKRVAEMLMQSMADASSKTTLAAVRFGNVLGSNGSVIPIFRQQISAGGPVTVTHPEMRRYFMTIPEATQLVLQAAVFARAGDVFVLDMGEPVYIVDVARDLIRLSGLRPDEDIRIEFSGIRPGEKLFEELSTDDEETSGTEHERIFRCEIEPPDRTTVEAAAERLHALALVDPAPADMRRALFDVLAALEARAPLDVVREATNNVVSLASAPRR